MGKRTNYSDKKRRKLEANVAVSVYDGAHKLEASEDTRDKGKRTEIHPGSFVNPAMRQMYGVKTPELDAMDTASADDESAGKEKKESREESKEVNKRVKRKVAFLLAYLGTNYGGFQMNAEKRTLQAELELAMFRCNLLSPPNFGFPHKYSFSISGRTDKGVHACAQVCSAKIELLPDQTMQQVLQDLNARLPEDFRVLDVNRVPKPFCAKTQRDRVRYQYMIPSFLLQDLNTLSTMFEQSGIEMNNRQKTDCLTPEEIARLQPKMETYRVSSQQLELLKQALRTYEGTHNFHNFTKGVKSNEARANRYIISYCVEDPIIFENGTEWIPTQVLGQSFLLHQIRKMIWLAVEVARGAVPLSLIERAFSPDLNIRVHPAPAQGLFLEMSYYGGYNRRKSNTDLPDLDWTKEDSDVYHRWKQFRNEVLMKHVVEEEDRDGNFINFLACQEFGDNREHYKLDVKDDNMEQKACDIGKRELDATTVQS